MKIFHFNTFIDFLLVFQSGCYTFTTVQLSMTCKCLSTLSNFDQLKTHILGKRLRSMHQLEFKYDDCVLNLSIVDFLSRWFPSYSVIFGMPNKIIFLDICLICRSFFILHKKIGLSTSVECHLAFHKNRALNWSFFRLRREKRRHRWTII